jgi:DNA-binding SARP family transcriptional activator
MNIQLLGRALLVTDRGATELDRKSAALLALLALEGEQSRSRLAAWLWNDSDGARNSLRQLLFKLPKGVIEGSDPLRLVAGVRADVHGEATLEGELLGAFDYADCPEFSDWLLLERERWRLRHDAGLEAQAEAFEARGDLTAALGVARRLVSAEPLSEQHHRRVMRLCERLGDRAGAVRAFEDCRAVLRRELNLEPSLETQRLAVLVARGVHLRGVAHLRPAPPPRLEDTRLEVRALLDAVRVLDSLGRADAAFENLHGACAVLAEIEATEHLGALVQQLEARATTPEMRARAAQARAWWHFQRGEFELAATCARAGLDLSGDPHLCGALAGELASALLRLDRIADALEWQWRAVEACAPNTVERAVALAEYALTLANNDRYRDAEAAYLEADALLEHFGAARHRVTALHNLAMTLKHQGRAMAALEPLEIAARLLSDIPGLVDDERYGHANRAEVLTQLARFDEALEALRHAERLSLEHDLPCSFVHFRRAQVHLLQGQPDAADASLEHALGSPGVHQRGLGFALVLRARVAAQRGADWRTGLEAGERLLREAGLRAYLARAGLVRAEHSEPSEGLTAALEVVAAAQTLEMRGLEASGHALAARHAHALGRDPSAHIAAAQANLETHEPLDLRRDAVLRLLEGAGQAAITLK